MITRDANPTHRLASGIDMVRSEDGLVPLVELATTMGFGASRDADPTAAKDTAILLIQLEGTGSVALRVDATEGQRQVVVKALVPRGVRGTGISAATILGDGKAALIVDPARLADRAATGDTTLEVEGAA